MKPTPETEHAIYNSPVEQGVEPDVIRTAIRAVVVSPGGILMVYSPVNGDYKFPGGGSEEGESHVETLVREVREETGQTVGQPSRCIARIREYGPARESDARVFMMESYYYLTQVQGAGTSRQRLDEYEARLGFTPGWVSLEAAIAANETVLRERSDAPRWTARETWVLRYLRSIAVR